MTSPLRPLLALACSAALAAQEARLLRFPHVHGDRVAFCYGGDIWTASTADGRARRVTSYDEGYEIFPRISPDGKWIAFSGEYSGTRQIYVVPFDGGEPRQLTFYPDVGVMPPRGGFDNLVFDWTPDGRHILVRSNRTPYGQRVGRYFLVDPNGGLEQPLQLAEGGPATFSPDGTKLAYNIISREWRTWKRYTAGRAQDVWIYDLRRDRIEQVTDFEGTDNWPMWVGSKIYFTSDRTGTLNLWAYDTATKATAQVTHFTDFDVLFPARGEGGIAFECGGQLWILDTATDRARKLSITLADDRPWSRPIWKDGATAFGVFDPSPSAKRAVVEFRGDLFSVPAEHGEGRNLTRTPDRREMLPLWSPDGRSIAFLAESGDDYELFLRGVRHGEERQLTRGTGAWITSVSWSPDSERLAFTDARNRLVVADARSGEQTVLDRASENPISSVGWSIDGRWLCYVKNAANGFGAVWICEADGGEPRKVTGDDWNDRSPTFAPEGDLLYFTSARDYRHDGYEFEERVFALLLRSDVADPTVPLSDEEGAQPMAKAEPSHDIDFDGIDDRLVVLPLPTSSYRGLAGVDGGLLFIEGGDLKHYDRASRESKTVLDGVRGYRLTADRKQLLYRHQGKLCRAKPSPGQKAGGDAYLLADVRVRVEPVAEWRQMYRDAWRIMRDWFYDPAMHGVDWLAMREKYQPLVDHIAHRGDLDFLIGELIGELNCGHTYVQPGETPAVDRTDVGVLGCELVAEAGRYRIAEIFDAENWNEASRNPLRAPGVDVAVGDWLIAIDGRELLAADNPYRLLEGTAGRRIELLVNSRPERFGARAVTVVPASAEQQLRYVTWVNRNRRLVDRLSGGRIGYIHVPNTGVPGHRELFEGWNAQARLKEAMIIDDRYNGGGFIPADMAQTLSQRTLNWWARRHQPLAPTPGNAFDGPQCMLINGYSSSGGDAFPYYFRALGVGKLIGKRTWGGLVGYSGTPRLVDGGGLAVPGFAFVNTAGEWDVEAYGVAPDIEVFDDPSRIARGEEPTIEAAVDHLLRELEQRGSIARPEVPPSPDRSGLGPGVREASARRDR